MTYHHLSLLDRPAARTFRWLASRVSCRTAEGDFLHEQQGAAPRLR